MKDRDDSIETHRETPLPLSYLILLFFIANGPKYGYQIIQLLRTRNYREWLDLKDSAVYRSLHELEQRGLITSTKPRELAQGRRRVYSITSQGRRVFQQQIFQCLSNLPRPKGFFNLGLLAMTVLHRNQFLEALCTRQNQLEERCVYLHSIIDALEQIETIRFTTPNHLIGKTPVSKIPMNNYGTIYALFNRSLRILQSEKQWLDTFIQQIRKNLDFPAFSGRS